MFFTIILVIIFGAFIISIGVFLLGTSPQAGAIIVPLLGGLIVYSGLWSFVAHLHLFSHFKAGPAGFEVDLQQVRDDAAAMKADEAPSEVKEEIRAIQQSDTSSLGFLFN